MKQFKLLTGLLICVSLVSCSGESTIEGSVVVEQINSVEKSECYDCVEGNYSYLVTLKSRTGTTHYYTNYKHEVGDTLVSIFEFTDNRERVIKKTESVIDSLTEVNTKLQKKNDELELYNSLLMGIIQENTFKQKEN